MSEEKTVVGAKKLWTNAVKAVRGDNTNQIVEEFTSEMTLVAEGLCEDQAKLRQMVDQLAGEQDRRAQRFESDLQSVESTIQENQRDLDRRLSDLSSRIREVENAQKALLKSGADKKEARGLNALMRQATILVGILAAAWVTVSVIGLFH